MLNAELVIMFESKLNDVEKVPAFAKLTHFGHARQLNRLDATNNHTHSRVLWVRVHLCIRHVSIQVGVCLALASQALKIALWIQISLRILLLHRHNYQPRNLLQFAGSKQHSNLLFL